jgi:hypothetical protein
LFIAPEILNEPDFFNALGQLYEIKNPLQQSFEIYLSFVIAVKMSEFSVSSDLLIHNKAKKSVYIEMKIS